MNKTKIEWTDFTWNPVTGCWGPGGMAEKPNRCAYCYAQKIANRFHSEPADDYYGSKKPDSFTPHFWPHRLPGPAKVKKPSKIFVCSMGDLFGGWVPSPWIFAVLKVAKDTPHHVFQFLTKNPKRLQAYNGFWSANCWVGTTVTNQADADERLHWLTMAEASVYFVSHEPLLGNIDVRPWFPRGLNWAIIGAMTGPGAVEYKTAWLQSLIDQYRAAGVPVFLKDNLKWPEKIQE